MAHLPTYALRNASVTDREVDVPLASFDNGMNLAASNAPGVGISTDTVNPKLDDWTILDQDEDARAPQTTQHLGGTGLEGGSATGYFSIEAIQGDQEPDGSGGTDNNDTLIFIEALAQAAPGVGFGAANADPINRGTTTIEIGDRAWGTGTVA